MMEQRLAGQDQLKWAAKLMEYDFEIQYHLGKDNKAADALSSRAEAMLALSTVKILDAR